MSGDFLPKRGERHGEVLCVCASLRFFERGTLEVEGEATRKVI